MPHSLGEYACTAMNTNAQYTILTCLASDVGVHLFGKEAATLAHPATSISGTISPFTARVSVTNLKPGARMHSHDRAIRRGKAIIDAILHSVKLRALSKIR
jgi:hypothetical protein